MTFEQGFKQIARQGWDEYLQYELEVCGSHGLPFLYMYTLIYLPVSLCVQVGGMDIWM